MAAHLSLSSVKLTAPDGTVTNRAQVLVRGSTLTVRVGGTTTTHEQVQSVQQTSRGIWTIRFPDASEWTVERVGRSCCGARRT